MSWEGCERSRLRDGHQFEKYPGFGTVDSWNPLFGSMNYYRRTGGGLKRDDSL